LRDLRTAGLRRQPGVRAQRHARAVARFEQQSISRNGEARRRRDAKRIVAPAHGRTRRPDEEAAIHRRKLHSARNAARRRRHFRSNERFATARDAALPETFR